MRANFEANATAQFRVLSRDECEKVVFAMMEVLWRTGVAVEDECARQLLTDNGAKVQGNRVRIPNDLMQRAIDSAPPRFTVYSREDPTRNLYIEPNRVYFGPGPTCPYFLDVETKERRRYLRKDAAATALTCDALSNIGFVESLGAIGDVRQTLADVYEFYEMMQQTVKPIVAWSFSLDACRDIHEMAVAVAGGRSAFDLRPNYIFYCEPMSPLHSGKDALEKLMYCAEHNIPLVYTPCPIAGGTAPATLAGVLVTALAESLHGLVISQLIRPGHGFIAGGVVSIMDMADTTLAYGAPELSLLSAALADVLKYLGIPMWSTGGCTDSKAVDQQAAIESAISCTMAGLSGANLVHDVGFIEGAMTGSLQMLVMSDEIIGMVRRLQRGVRVDEETLAVDVIDAVGPGGHFLSQAHTLRHFRDEFWFPTLMDRKQYENWTAAGSKTMGDRVDARLRKILATHRPVPVPDSARETMDDIIVAAEEREEAKVRAERVNVNYRVQGTTHFRLLTDDQIEAIYHAALEVLERTGCRVYDEEGLWLLREAGGVVTDKTLARIPAAAVKDALSSCPQKVTLCARDGSSTLHLQGSNFYYGTGSDCPFIYDEGTGKRREYTYADCERSAHIFDALPNLDFFMSVGLVSDVPRMTYDRHQFVAMVTNTAKPLVLTAVDRAGLKDIHDMCCLIRGGPDEFRLRPNFALYAEPSSPLRHSTNAVQKLLFAAEVGIPTIYTPCPIMGATAPATFAGAIVQGLAECLCGVVMAQRKKRGAPLIIGGVISSLDMHDTVLTYGSPELHVASAAYTEVVRWLGMPMFSTGGTSDSKVVDQQAAIENAMSLLVATLSGANLIHDISFLEGALIASDEMVVMSDEIAGMCRHIARGLRVDEDTLAVDVIDRVGPGGHFLSDDHTVKHYREEFWFPTLMDRKQYENWVGAGSKTMGDRIKDNIAKITTTHEVAPIPADTLAGMNAILKAADEGA